MESYYMGIDVGSLSTDGVIIDESSKIIRSVILPTGSSILNTINRCREDLLADNDNNSIAIKASISTGYGRKRVEFADSPVTEITAHALGALSWFPDTRTVIDIGGQDTKVIRINEKGGVIDFAMNDRCAAGTGRFLEVMARILEVDLDEMAEMAVKAKKAVDVTSTCTVFIESEIISLISKSEETGSIAAGVYKSIAGRIGGMVNSLKGKPPFTLTGGVAKNKAMVHALRQILPGPVQVPEDPQITGALGSAIYGMRKFMH